MTRHVAGGAERKEHRDSALSRERMQRVGLQRAVGFHVPEHEVLQVGTALEGDAGSLPHGAVRTVAPHQVSRAHLLDAAVAVTENTMHNAVFHGKAGELDLALDHDRQRCEILAEERFGLRLRDEEDERKAGVGGSESAELDLRDAVLRVDRETRTRPSAPDQPLADPEALEHLEASRLHRERA
jgi:hypothetical protein